MFSCCCLVSSGVSRCVGIETDVKLLKLFNYSLTLRYGVIAFYFYFIQTRFTWFIFALYYTVILLLHCRGVKTTHHKYCLF